MRPFPWDEVLRTALGHLGWTPATFWAATPREVAWALAPPANPEPMGRADLDRLMSHYPDEAKPP